MSTGVGDVERAAVPMEPVGKANSEYGAVVAAACPKMGVALGLVKCGGKSESASRAEPGHRGRVLGGCWDLDARLVGRALAVVCLS